MPITDHFKNKAISAISETQFYIALFDGDPAKGGVEVTTKIAAERQKVAMSSSEQGSIRNAERISFGRAEKAAKISHYGLFDAKQGGKLYVYGEVDTEAHQVYPGTEVAFDKNFVSVSVL